MKLYVVSTGVYNEDIEDLGVFLSLKEAERFCEEERERYRKRSSILDDGWWVEHQEFEVKTSDILIRLVIDLFRKLTRR